jgi:hypothetical protein
VCLNVVVFKYQRVVSEFEAAIDPDSQNGSLYRLLVAYACLDPHIGYVQGMNFVAALLVAPTVLAHQASIAQQATVKQSLLQADIANLAVGKEATAKQALVQQSKPLGDNAAMSSEAAPRAATNAVKATLLSAPPPPTFQGCPLSVEDEAVAFGLLVRLMQASGLRRVFDAQDDHLHTLLLRLEFHVHGLMPTLHEHLEQVSPIVSRQEMMC